MNYLNSIKLKEVSNTYPFVFYIGKFLLLFTLLYCFNYLIIGLAAPGNFYSSFVKDWFNHIEALRYTIMHASYYLTKIFGYNTTIEDGFVLRVINGHFVRVFNACLALGVMDFWIAFVVANKGKLKDKIIWTIGGCFCIWVINCFRIAILLIAINSKWNINGFIDHHTLFNIVAYLFIFFLMYLYNIKFAEE